MKDQVCRIQSHSRPPSTPWNSIPSSVILGKAELSQPQYIPTLAEPRVRDFGSSLPSNIHEARSLLVQQRISEPGYRQPDQQKRHIFRTKERRETKCDTDNWIFTKHEVAKAFDHLLSRAPLPVPGVAQALLSHASKTSLDKLRRHLYDPELEERMESRSKNSRPPVFSFPRSSLALKTRSSLALETTSAAVPGVTWLDQVCGQENLEYIHLLCQTGLRQAALNRAFSIALSKHSMPAMELLLSFGAVASAACRDAIRERVRLHDLALVKLLLSAPNAMSVEGWRVCMEPEVESLEVRGGRSPDLLLLCLAHHPSMVCRPLLLQALESQNTPAMAIILAYGLFIGEHFSDLHQPACEIASSIQDGERRHKFFTVLIDSGFVDDGLVLRQELMKDVAVRQLPLIKLLVDAGVIPDIEPYNAFYWSIKCMDLEILELLKNCRFYSSVSLALKFVPDSTSELDMLRLLGILGPTGLAGEPLDSHLVRAVRRKHIQLVYALLRHDASVEFEQASAIQTALKNTDFDILSILLQSKCSASILSTTIPTAMVLQPRPIRLQAMKALVEKGVMAQELGVPLQTLVSEDGDVDSELIRLLLRHGAPIDGVGNEAKNAVLVAAQRGNLSVLRMLCDAGPRNETLSNAVPAAFDVISSCGYDAALDMIKLLLKYGASGLPTHQTLLAAAKQDVQLDIVRLLVKHGADANYASGAPFAAALQTGNFTLLQLICASCPPSQSSIESVLSTAIHPLYYNSEALELLLGSTPSAAAALDASWSSCKFSSNCFVASSVPCFLRHGLNVNLGNGALLSFAIQENNIVLLGNILAANPSIASLITGFQTATKAQPRSLELETMRLLLEKAKSAEIGQSESLLQQAHFALSGDFAGLQLLFRHKAVADRFTFTKACLVTMSSTISWNEKQKIIELFLAASAGVLPQDMSKLLADSVERLPECTQLPQLLLAHGAEVTFETLKISLETSSRDLFEVLVSSTQSPNTVLRTFKHVRRITMVPDRRYWSYQYLLSKGIPSDDVSEALLDSLEAQSLGDLSVPKLLLEHGASPGYQNGEAFLLSLRASSPLAVRLLTQYLVDDSMATVAFDAVRKTPLLKTHLRVEIYRSLLEWNISKPIISQVLVDIFNGGHPDISFLQLLLAKGADPNKAKGHCFAVASRAGAIPEFRALSVYAKRRVVLKVLLNNFQEECEIIRWYKIYLEEQPRLGKVNEDELVFQCMRKFPGGTTLLKLLLDQGASASAKIDHCLCARWKPEQCTALIWALFSKPRIENNVILILLAQGGDAALPAYSTPQAKVSAAFGCLLDKSRTPILEALLDQDRDQISDYVIPGSSFGPLSVDPEVFQKDSGLLDAGDELPLREASLYLGNFDAFRLLTREMTPNDGMLHLAALMALPKFVEWLLNMHDPNHKAEEFDNMIPLALVCASKPQPWCKIANEESDWKTRQKQTMQLLAPKTSPKWRYRNMTILHYAMENGPDTAKAMIEALDIHRDSERDEKYLYMDRDGIEYSPQQYVTKVLDADKKEKEILVTLLEEAGLISRYFKRILPEKGDQPMGYHGLPLHYAALWEAHEEGDQSWDDWFFMAPVSKKSKYRGCK